MRKERKEKEGKDFYSFSLSSVTYFRSLPFLFIPFLSFDNPNFFFSSDFNLKAHLFNKKFHEFEVLFFFYPFLFFFSFFSVPFLSYPFFSSLSFLSFSFLTGSKCSSISLSSFFPFLPFLSFDNSFLFLSFRL